MMNGSNRQSLIRVIDPPNAEVLGKVSLPKGTGSPHLAVSRGLGQTGPLSEVRHMQLAIARCSGKAGCPVHD
jgi:hypothetical protein